jgi:vacuolar protein-sorting-associated protein 4
MKTARDAFLQSMMQATHFRQTKDQMWHACAAEDPDAVAMMWDKVPAGRMCKVEISLKDVNQAMTRVIKSVSPDELGRFESWTRDFGQDG